MMKEWRNRGMMGQVSPKSSWERTSWGEREGENFYKRKGGATGDGIQKN